MKKIIEILQKGIENSKQNQDGFVNELQKVRTKQYLLAGLIAKIESGQQLDEVDFDVIVENKLDIVAAYKTRKGVFNEDNILDWSKMYNIPNEFKFPWEF